MNIHQNARLTPLGRERMVRAIASAFYRDVRDSPFGFVCRPPCCQAAAGSRPKRNTVPPLIKLYMPFFLCQISDRSEGDHGVEGSCGRKGFHTGW